MSETLLTKCPHCSTTFRLTPAQLQIAGGAVRCGACYQVFHANEHIVKTAVVEEIRQAPAPRPDPVEEAFKMEDDKGLDPYDTAELDLDNPDADLFSEDYRKSMEPESSLDEFGYATTEAPKAKKGTDESWAEDLLKELGDDAEDDDGLIHDDMDGKQKKSAITSAASAFDLDEDELDRPKPKKKKSGDDLSDTFRTLGAFSSDDPFAISNIEEDEFEHNDTQQDESWAKAMLDELEEEQAPTKKPEGLAIMAEEKPTADANPYAARDLARNRREAVERAKAEDRTKPKAPKKAAATEKNLRNAETEEFFRLLEEPNTSAHPAAQEPSLQLADLNELKDLETDLGDTGIKPNKLFKDANEIVNQQIKYSTLRFADEEPQGNPGRTLLLVVGALILILVGLAQYAWFNLDTLARNPQWRPLLEQACGALNCQLPRQVDLSAIKSTNLSIRSHPHERNALVIDALIKNMATFEQPFPAVRLIFTDNTGSQVANRVFQPKEYIHDASIDFQRMPPNVPVHLTLEIVDPHVNNYSIEFLTADAAP